VDILLSTIDLGHLRPGCHYVSTPDRFRDPVQSPLVPNAPIGGILFRMMHRAPLLWLGLCLMGCAPKTTKFVFVPPPTAEAMSLLGDTLWTLPIKTEDGPGLVFRLDEARDRVTQNPGSIDARLVLGRRTEEMGRLRGAIRVYTQAMQELNADRRLWWRRGRLLLQIREVDLAIRDFQYAAQDNFAPSSKGRTEFEELRTGEGVAVTTILYSTFHYLGFAYYVQGSFEKARIAFATALNEAASTDETIATLFWLFLASQRAGLVTEGRALLEGLDSQVDLAYARAELDMLLAFRGDREIEDLPVDLNARIQTGDQALYAYGIGVGLLLLDRIEEATLLFERVRRADDWTRWPVLAAEADLTRLRGETP